MQFEVVDGESLPFREQFDGVFSNAALHWMTQPEKVAEGIWRSLKPGGRFVAEFGGKGNVSAIVAAVRKALEGAGYPQNAAINFWYFPSMGEYATLLEAQGFEVSWAALFYRPTPLEEDGGIQDWLKMFATPFFGNIPPEAVEEILAEIEGQLRPQLFRNGVWRVDDRRLRVMAIRQR